MRVVMAQMNVKAGNIEENFAFIKQTIEQAKLENAHMVVFPEMCVSGYLLQDKWLDDEFCQYVHSYNDKIRELSEDIGVVFGNLYYDSILGTNMGRDGRKSRFNAVLFAQDKKWVKKENSELSGIHIKHLNPDYRIFDDSRYFLSGIEVAMANNFEKHELVTPFLMNYEGSTVKVGLEVCEDLWSDDYSVKVSELYILQGVEFIVNVSSSPYTINKEKSRDKRINEHKLAMKEKMVPILYVNACGMQNTGKNFVVFDGGSCVFDANGDRVYSLNDAFAQEVSTYDFVSKVSIKSTSNKLLQALCCAIREVDEQMFKSSFKWIIGLSGGIDSSINACLLVMALGNERVIGYNMASNYNSSITKNNARLLADKLGIEIREGSIEALNKASIETMNDYQYKDEYGSLVYENIQARIRGHLLSTFASIEGGVIMNNANKVEVALGYCTLYGDCIGAISPIGDLTKVQCFEVARACNTYFKEEVISMTLIPEDKENEIIWGMPPSAELKEDQLDPMKWYYHDYLITYLTEYPTGRIEVFMDSYLDGSVYETPIGKWIAYYNLTNGEVFIKDLEWVLKTMYLAVFKRIQMPPVVMLSRGAFGSDYRESQLGFIQTDKYKVIRSKILEIK